MLQYQKGIKFKYLMAKANLLSIRTQFLSMKSMLLISKPNNLRAGVRGRGNTTGVIRKPDGICFYLRSPAEGE